jgi:hypothetical protein
MDMYETPGMNMRPHKIRLRSLPRTVIFLTSISRTPPAEPSSAFSSWMSARRCGLDEVSERHLANASVAARLHHAQVEEWLKSGKQGHTRLQYPVDDVHQQGACCGRSHGLPLEVIYIDGSR